MLRVIALRRLRVAAGVAALVAALPGGRAAAANEPAGVVAAIEAAPAVVVAEVRSVAALPHTAFRATLAVERSLRPDSPAPEMIEVAWEEPAPSLPPRLAEGRRVLVAAEPLPSASIWRTRVPDDAARARLLAIAGRGAGYLERPGGAELDILEHYLLVGEAARAGDAGALHLARLCAVGQPRLALDAAERLRAFDALPEHLTPGAARALVEALQRGDVRGQREVLLDLIALRRPPALRAPLEASIRSGGGAAAPPVLHAALGALEGQLDDDHALPLLESGSAESRAAAARHAAGPRTRGRLRDLVIGDPSPSVRAAAVTRLVELDGMQAFSDATLAFDDDSAEVRAAAARAVARLDPAPVDSLRRLVEVGRVEEAKTALVALSMMGEEAHLALAELAVEHPDPAIRTLAGIAVGQPIGDTH